MISTTRELASKLNVKYNFLTFLLYIRNTNNCYTSFDILKKNGTARKINAPIKELKIIQKNLACLLYKEKAIIDNLRPKKQNLSHGFEKDKSIITNARVHRNKRFVLNIDLDNFFDKFHFGRIAGYFQKNKNFLYPKDVAIMIAQICCFNGTLPQGAPTSPILTNLICQTLDIKILTLAKEFKLNFTRYADDLTFSTNDKNFIDTSSEFLKKLKLIINCNGFTINDSKTRLAYKNSKQKVTGLIVNKKINIDNNFYKNTKAMADSYYKTNSFSINGKIGTIQQLEGRFSFIDQLDKYNNINSTDKKSYPFNRREIEYQKFLFYKYFLNNNKPLIITEGKTDPLYIKAALKSLSSKHSTLIQREGDDFNLKVDFFKKRKKFEYFFRFPFDGGDAIQRIYELYKGIGLFSKCNKIIKKYSIKPTIPVIMLLDNETISKDKPLCKFLKICGIKGDELDKFTKEHYYKVFSELNLYLVTIPLIDKKKETEIEDLLDNDTLAKNIDGRTFLAKAEKNDSLHYSKDVLSKYVYDNYKTINFENFNTLLDTIHFITKK